MIGYPVAMEEAPKKIIIPTDREKTIGVRVSLSEYEAIKARADAVGLRVASYLRLLALQDAAPPQLTYRQKMEQGIDPNADFEMVMTPQGMKKMPKKR